MISTTTIFSRFKRERERASLQVGFYHAILNEEREGDRQFSEEMKKEIEKVGRWEKVKEMDNTEGRERERGREENKEGTPYLLINGDYGAHVVTSK